MTVGLVSSSNYNGVSFPQRYANLNKGMFLSFNMATFDGQEQSNPNSNVNLFNPTTGLSSMVDSWVSAAKALGARYTVLTVKHTDGFCLWPSATTPHNISSSSPWYANNGNQDIIPVFISKMKAAGIIPCLYYCIADATFQQSQGKGPLGNYIGYDSTQLAQLQSDYNQAAYLAYVQAQITELLTNYGPIFAIWLDTLYYEMANTYYPWSSASAVLSFIKGLQPNIVVVNNTHRGITTDTDVITSETGAPIVVAYPQEVSDPIQANNNWFWHGDTTLKSTATVVANYRLCNVAGCSYLLDCPPDNTGVIPTAMMTAIQQIGAAL